MISIEHNSSMCQYTEEEITVQIPDIGEKKAHADFFHHILFGDDMHTCKYTRGSKRICSNSVRGLDGLEGLLPVVEDWQTNKSLL